MRKFRGGRYGRGLCAAGAAAVLLAAISTGTGAAAEPDDTGPVVATDRGLVRGTTAEEVRTFQGIPYAAPPVGARRWKAPRPAQAWSGVRDATRPAAACPQQPGEVPGGSVDEDCLYVNVTAPKRMSPTPRPVVVWVHGGGFTAGSGTSYDARRLAAEGGVVVVTINYRLGVFGNLAYPGLRDGGTFGLLDQLAAMDWARRNAPAFGGDPRNITAAGESAGAMSICAHLTAPKARGAFDKAIMESGSCLLNWTKNTWYPGLEGFGPYLSKREAHTFAAEAAAKLGCAEPATAVACLRGKSVEELLPSGVFNAPVHGTGLLPEDPAEAVRAGRFHRMPLLSGGTRDEANGSAAQWESAEHVTEEAYQSLLRDSFGSGAEKVAAAYPSRDYAMPAAAWGAVASDRAWACPTLEGNRRFARGPRTYAFEFADRTAPNLGPPAPPGFPVGAAHAFELPYLFDLGGENLLRTPAQRRLAAQMVGYWSNFARTGAPNGPGLPYWAPARPGAAVPYTQSLESGPGLPGPADMAARHNCDLWRTIPQS